MESVSDDAIRFKPLRRDAGFQARAPECGLTSGPTSAVFSPGGTRFKAELPTARSFSEALRGHWSGLQGQAAGSAKI